MLKKIWRGFCAILQVLFEDPCYNRRKAYSKAFYRMDEIDQKQCTKLGLDPYSMIEKGEL